MPTQFRQIREFLDTLPHDNRAASGPDVIKRDNRIHDKVIAKNVQKPDVRNKIQALAGKQPEFNRGKGTQRHPHSPPQKVTGPNELGSMGEENQENHMKKSFKQLRESKKETYMTQLHKDQFHYNHQMWMKAEEAGDRDAAKHYADLVHHHAYWHKKISGRDIIPHFISKGPIKESRNNEYNANVQLSSSKGSRKPGHYLMRHGVPLHNQPHATSQQALSAYHNLSDKSNVKIQHVKEEVVNEAQLTRVREIQDNQGNHIGVVGQSRHKPGYAFHHSGLFQTRHGYKSEQDAERALRRYHTDMFGNEIKEEAPAMSAGAAGDPGHVQNASDNYASQRKRLSMFRRKNPLVGPNNNQNLNVGTTSEAYSGKGAFHDWAKENKEKKHQASLAKKHAHIDQKVKMLHDTLILRHHRELIKNAHKAEARGNQNEWEDAVAAIANHQRKHPHLKLPGHLD